MDGQRAPRLALRKSATRDRIVREAFELFGRNGFEATTVDAIVVRSDVAKGTFFNYFPRKEALVTHLFERRLRAAVASATDLIGIGIPVRDKLLDLYTEAAGGHEDDTPMTRRLLAAEAARALGSAGDQDFAHAWRDVVIELVRQGVRSGELKRTLDPAQAARVLNAVYLAVLEGWARGAIHDLRAAVREHLALVLEGLGA